MCFYQLRQNFFLPFLTVLHMTGVCYAADVEVFITDQKKNRIANSVVYLMAPNVVAAPTSDVFVIEQINKQYVPFVSAVPVGAMVSFPNKDTVRHHVYSFSAAKSFELKLYQGKAVQPVLFDKKGLVALGCNIHDWMVSYVYVVDTPYYSVTDQHGRARIGHVPLGDYTLHVWHPGKKQRGDYTRQILVKNDKEAVDVSIRLKPKRFWEAAIPDESEEY